MEQVGRGTQYTRMLQLQIKMKTKLNKNKIKNIWHFNTRGTFTMKDLYRKSAKLILDILESVQKESKVLLKQCQSDKNCNLETYENIVDKCKELEYTIEEIKELL